MENILISIKPKFAARIIGGEKRVEIRRRKMNISKGDRLWIYSSCPSASLEAFATVDSVAWGNPLEVWPRVSSLVDIPEETYRRYLAGSNLAFAIFLGDVVRLATPLSLKEIRQGSPGFHPPQFFHRIPGDSPLLKMFCDAFVRERRE
jgi:predicted transcriptional regulator